MISGLVVMDNRSLYGARISVGAAAGCEMAIPDTPQFAARRSSCSRGDLQPRQQISCGLLMLFVRLFDHFKQ